jgi:hypothetical protein
LLSLVTRLLRGNKRVNWYHSWEVKRSPAGLPDLVIVGARGCLWRELKSPRGQLLPEQVLWQYRLIAAGENYGIWRPRDWPERIEHELEQIS